jgi:uncharacterized repeat protein (TIGR01451 family)
MEKSGAALLIAALARQYKERGMKKHLTASVAFLFLFSISVASAQLIYLDDFSEFSNGQVLTETNYTPGVWSLPASAANIFTNTPGFGTMTASNLLGSIRLFFDAKADPGGDNAGYAAEFSSNNGSNLTAFVTNAVVDVQWLSWIANTSSSSHTGGLAVSVSTTNMDTGCDTCSIKFESQPIVFYADVGKVYAFTNDPNNGVGQLPIVQIGTWSAFKNTIMTNHLVLNYPARTFSLSLNGVVLTNNMVITPFFTNIFAGMDLSAVEILATSSGNKFAVDDVQIVLPNTNQDVRDFIIAAKGQQFEQTSASAPSPSATSWSFHSDMQAVQTDSVWTATVHFTGGGKTNLVQESGDASYLSFDDAFTLQTALDAAYGDGVYRLSILGETQGLQESSLNLSGNSYPNTPQIANYNAGQAINASQDFTLQWNSSGGGASDLVKLEVDTVNGDTLIATPDFSHTNALTGAVTSYLIPAGTLQASSTYTGQLLFVRLIALDTNSVPGAVGTIGYFKQTAFALATLSPPGASCVLTPALATNDVGTVHTVTATVTTNSVAAAGVTVNLVVTGVNSISTNLMTDAGGQTTFGYTSSLTGTDTIQAAGSVSGLSFTGTATEVWLAANIPPVAICQNITVPAGAGCQATVSAAQVDNGSSDSDGSIVSRALTPPGPYAFGTNLVTLTVTDNRGGTNSCSATIVVVDSTPPTITCPANIVTNVPFGQTNAVVNFPAPTIGDNCSGTSTNFVPPSGSTFALGTNAVTVTATDRSGNTNSCTFNVIVAQTPAQADLAVTAVSAVATASLNNAFGFTLTVTNKGPQDAAGAQLVDPLPSGVTFDSATSSVGSCTNIGGVLTCSFGTLANAATATVSVVVTPTDPTVANACTTATVTNTLLDPVTANNSVTACLPVVIDNLAVTAFTAPKKVALSAKKPNGVGKLAVTIQNRSLHTEVVPSLAVLSNLVTVTLIPISSNGCATPVPQLVTPKSTFPITLAPGKSLKLAYTVNFTCATDPLATSKTANHDDYQYLVTVQHQALDGLADSRPADDTCPHNALGADPYNTKIKDKGCGLKVKGAATGTLPMS